MDELLKNYISRQLRKKGKDYPLSEGSQLTAKGFGNLNKMVSKWYHAFKTINPWLTKRNTYNDLLARLQKLRKHNEQLTEEQKNQYTHANMLVGLRVNQRVSWDTLVDWEPHINWEREQSSIQIIIPEHRELRIQNLPPRFSRVGITFHVFVGDYTNMSEEIRIYPAKTIFVKPQEKHKRLQTRLLIELFEDSLIAIVGTAQYFSFNGQDGSDSASFNKQHYASNIIECLHIRRERLLASREKPIDRLVPLLDTNLDQGAEWESD